MYGRVVRHQELYLVRERTVLDVPGISRRFRFRCLPKVLPWFPLREQVPTKPIVDCALLVPSLVGRVLYIPGTHSDGTCTVEIMWYLVRWYTTSISFVFSQLLCAKSEPSTVSSIIHSQHRLLLFSIFFLLTSYKYKLRTYEHWKNRALVGVDEDCITSLEPSRSSSLTMEPISTIHRITYHLPPTYRSSTPHARHHLPYKKAPASRISWEKESLISVPRDICCHNPVLVLSKIMDKPKSYILPASLP
jgi:hypothetical protein